MRHLHLLPLLSAAAILGGCASATVYGVVGDENDLYTGTATGYIGRTGTIELKNANGNRCTGDFAYTSHRRGHGVLACDDGQRATIVFNGLSAMSGYGGGTSNTGRQVAFTYGLSREESAHYLGFNAGAAAPGSTPPAASQRTSSGTGFFVSRQGHVLTNEHVVRDCKDARIVRIAGATVAASIVSADRSNDLAVLKADTSPSSVAAFRSRPARQGEAVVAYGFPLTGSLSSGGVLTTGSVSALAGLRDDTRYIQMSAPIQAGNSGGPVLDAAGGVIGIATASLVARRARDTPQNVNFALKADVARTFLDVAGVTPETAPSGRDLSAPDLAERARGFTVRVECGG